MAVGGLLYFKVWHKPPSTRPSPPSTAIDLPGYFATFDQLAGRLSEQEEFVNSLKGKKVRWRGYVSYVRNSDVSPSKISLAITPTSSDQFQMAALFQRDVRPAVALRGRTVILLALRLRDLTPAWATRCSPCGWPDHAVTSLGAISDPHIVEPTVHSVGGPLSTYQRF